MDPFHDDPVLRMVRAMSNAGSWSHSGHAHASALVGAEHPEVALISVGLDNRYGHPTAETLAALARVLTYRTDRDGTDRSARR